MGRQSRVLLQESIGGLQQAPGSQVPHLFLGRSEILLALSFSRIDLGPLRASEKALTHFGFARVFQR